MTQYILALDQGTTSSRALVVDRQGRVQGVAQQPLTQHFPQPGWVEHDPAEIWDTQLQAARQAMDAAGCAVSQIAAIGITNQRETTLIWERSSGRPLHRAIVWQDRRTASICDALRSAGHEPLFTQRTGLLLDPYFSGTKVRWLLDHIPDGQARAASGELCFGTVDSWLIWRLTGGRTHVTDVSNASRTLLMDLRAQQWDEALLDILRIPAELLPRIVPSSQVVASDTQGIPIAGIAGDQQAALFGQRCVRPGMVKNTYGTGCFMLAHTGNTPVLSEHGLLTTAACAAGGQAAFALEGSVFVAGAAVQWLRDGLGIIQDAAQVESLAASVPDNGGVFLVPAFTGLGAPHWEPRATGLITGLTRGSTAAHLARATLEAIAFQNVDLVRAMELDARMQVTELRVDGGAARNDLLMQFQADVLGVPVVRPRLWESTALGAAYLAGLAVGYWAAEAELDALWAVERRFEPTMAAERREALLIGWRDAIERTRQV